MQNKKSEGEVDLVVYEKLIEQGWKRNDTLVYQHSFAPGRIFPKEDYKFARDNPFQPEFVLYYTP